MDVVDLAPILHGKPNVSDYEQSTEAPLGVNELLATMLNLLDVDGTSAYESNEKSTQCPYRKVWADPNGSCPEDFACNPCG